MNPEPRRDEKKLWQKISISAAILVVLVGTFIWGSKYGIAMAPKTSQIRYVDSAYPYIHPLILVDNASETFPDLDPLEDSMSAYIDTAEKSGAIEDVSVYYRDMTTGEWTGVNENDTYEPSSMLKVGVLMSYLYAAETTPSMLTESLPYTPTGNWGQYYKPATTLTAGDYSANDLMADMIEQSDNDALVSLSNANPTGIVQLFTSLNIPLPPSDSPVDLMSPEMYSRLFRTLYNATYLPPDKSEYALELLMKTDFNGGLVAGVASSTIAIAHKFGEQTNTENGTTTDRELHDCGIIYTSPDPYFLCVMTKGSDFPTLQKIISDISALTFKYVTHS